MQSTVARIRPYQSCYHQERAMEEQAKGEEDHWLSPSVYDVRIQRLYILTMYFTACGRCIRIILIAYDTSMVCSLFIRSMQCKIVARAPLLPKPSLHIRITGPLPDISCHFSISVSNVIVAFNPCGTLVSVQPRYWNNLILTGSSFVYKNSD